MYLNVFKRNQGYLFDQKYSCEILLSFIFFLFVTQSWISSNITPVFRVTWSFRYHTDRFTAQ